MDLLKKQLDRVQQQLAGLSASQKMLTMSLLAIMVITFLWWGKYAGSSEQEPLFNQAITADEMQNVKRALTAEGIPFDPNGDKILVPSEKKDYAVAILAYAQVLPKSSTGSFEDMIGKMSPFTSDKVGDSMTNEFLQQKLANVIRNMPGVGFVEVFLDPTHDHLIGGDVEPKATISVQMRTGSKGDKKLAEAIAEMVSGANARMRRSRVSVVIDGHVFPVHDRDENMPDGELEEQQAVAEKRNADKIKTALSYIPGEVIAVVSAKIDNITMQKSETTHPNIVVKEKSSENDTSNTVTPQPGIAEPGAAANTGGTLSVGQGPVSANSTADTEHTKSESTIIADETVSQTKKPAGESTIASATVSVPRSYFIGVLKRLSASDKEPAPADVDKAFADERTALLAKVMNAVNLTDEKKVSVDMYFDAPLLMASGASSASGSSSASSGMTVALTGHVKEIAVGILALVSLFMVSSMVKKSAPAPVIAATVEAPEPVTLGGNIDIAGEVSEGSQTLDGMELDDDAVKAQQMVEQVSTMVKENPDGAATMVKRWLNRS